MQLTKTNKVRPITLATFAMLSMPSSVYADIAKGSDNTVIIEKTPEYFYSANNASQYGGFVNKEIFDFHYKKWMEGTMFYSNVDAIVNNSHFNYMVSMGKDAVPFILEKISEDPSHLVWALNRIYNVKISNNPNMTIEGACKLWVKKLMK